MISFPNAKINLGLSVIACRDDGFHNIETLFYPVPLFDILELVKSSDIKTKFTRSGIEVASDYDSDLCMRALNLLKKDFEIPPLKIHLHKNIPPGAGLGGGSSDGAFMIKMLNEYFELGLTEQQMENYAGILGSDCPFFIRNHPRFAKGKGNEFEDVNIDLSGYFLLIIKPPFSISTKEAYESIKPSKSQVNLYKLSELPVSQWQGKMVNDFETVVFKKHPILSEIKSNLYELGAVFALMSGSGTAIYGIFKHEINPHHHFPGFFCHSAWLT
ncbi:MAG: 4-(cytidine 5'-diphospho)-2-C-methyl-D-erythritol kinase [Bacteroidales bacterium]|jgi:4-diphosphocytidyl-2-C-methyl-D-erythritol kinase|nr:4-(cytidine 5'-diphospho)-2-C-methyl-D-erythritol kinase [Bacteroidales bacterium]MDI9593201.1 4-(cytidine 5'-diphospho)-2-C-methyl-D-erythritol kinase [Bacteroidota bacterium]HNY59938.1 4-(cytidine 5'-diphospho)-2-C-methyl-D-erythritol kinase [Bacteroidales bacterium]HOF81502.1 4-(cytidine 5'-diphospho)-2-C-methyl-D-erythritol kinase [Bacteroidales bacterium]HOG67257.1 4-(cytidine 5'-diphospho)-2-C-methyl-D-erythritol kinase [Bacteroidales bacterium]